MKAKSVTQMIISHPEEREITDLTMNIENAERIVADEDLLYAFNVFLKELRNHGYNFDLIGGDDDD